MWNYYVNLNMIIPAEVAKQDKELFDIESIIISMSLVSLEPQNPTIPHIKND